MSGTPVVTCVLRHDGDVLLCERSDAVGSYPGRWGAVSGHVASGPERSEGALTGRAGSGATREPGDPERSEGSADGTDRTPGAAARAEIREETGIDPETASVARVGQPFPVSDDEFEWLVHPYLVDVPTREVTTNDETASHEWVPPTAILERETVPALWTSYDRVRPRVATVAEDRDHGSAHLAARALEVLRDEAAVAAAGRGPRAHERREADGEDWPALVGLARRLRRVRPSMAVVRARVDRAMAAASDEGTPAALSDAAHDALRAALAADRRAAERGAAVLGDRVATLSRSGTVRTAIDGAAPDAVLVAESRPGREGVDVAEALAEASAVTLTTDAAFPAGLAEWDASALVVGADRVLPDGRIVNKVGTRAAALAAPPDCPVYVLAATDKVAPDATVDREPRDPTEVYAGDADLTVANPTFDVTPPAAIDAVVTELGPLAPTAVGQLAAAHRERAAWVTPDD